jgi:hypothetical protein
MLLIPSNGMLVQHLVFSGQQLASGAFATVLVDDEGAHHHYPRGVHFANPRLFWLV